jgi:lipid A 3-O-deacylase
MKAWALLPWTAALAALCAGSPVFAQEVVGGFYAHDVKTPLDLRGIEGGVDLQLGYRGERLGGLSAIGAPSPYAFVALNSSNDVHYAAAGLSWKIGGDVFLRPGIGLAVHTGSLRVDPAEPRRSLGSRILFEPELGIGFRVSERMTLEASWVHMSNATILSHQNPGIDNLGVRLSYRLR